MTAGDPHFGLHSGDAAGHRPDVPPAGGPMIGVRGATAAGQPAPGPERSISVAPTGLHYGRPMLPGPPRPVAAGPTAPRAGLPPRPEARPRVVDEPGILGLSRRARSRLGSRLFTLFFVFVFGLIVIQMVAVLLVP